MGQMCWLPISALGHEKILHLRESPQSPWIPYTRSPHKVADYSIPTQYGTPSRGFSTAQKLLKDGWTYVQSPASNLVQEDREEIDSQAISA